MPWVRVLFKIEKGGTEDTGTDGWLRDQLAGGISLEGCLQGGIILDSVACLCVILHEVIGGTKDKEGVEAAGTWFRARGDDEQSKKKRVVR